LKSLGKGESDNRENRTNPGPEAATVQILLTGGKRGGTETRRKNPSRQKAAIGRGVGSTLGLAGNGVFEKFKSSQPPTQKEARRTCERTGV